MPRCLGLHPPKRDSRTLRFARYLVPAVLPPVPASQDWTAKVSQWGVMLNDRIGDCGIACPGHMIQCWTANNGGELTVPDADILAAYEAVTGMEGAAYDPQSGANDNGVNALDAIKYWRAAGIGGHRAGAFASVQPDSAQEFQEAIFLTGGLYLGLALPLATQQMGATWDVPRHIPFFRRRLWEPGSWGGHAVAGLAYDAQGVKIVTWGEIVNVTWAYLAAYCQEAFAIVSPDWLTDANKTPSGFDAASLASDLQVITGQPVQ